MTDPATLRASFVAMLRDIPALVALHENDADNIVDYVEEENGDLFNTIWGLRSPKLLVVHQGTRPSGGQTTMWAQDFSLMVRQVGSPSAVLVAILDGIPATLGNGLKLILQRVHADYQPMSLPSMRRAVIPVSDQSSKDYWEITTTFISRGFE